MKLNFVTSVQYAYKWLLVTFGSQFLMVREISSSFLVHANLWLLCSLQKWSSKWKKIIN